MPSIKVLLYLHKRSNNVLMVVSLLFSIHTISKSRESKCTEKKLYFLCPEGVLGGVISCLGFCLMHEGTWRFPLTRMQCFCSSCGHAHVFDGKRWYCFVVCSHLHHHACMFSFTTQVICSQVCSQMNLCVICCNIQYSTRCTNAMFLLCILTTSL